MKDSTFEKKINRDVDRIKKDIATLGDDGAAKMSQVFSKWTKSSKKTAAGINKGVEEGLSTYNDKVQDVADSVPGGFSKKAAGYPWVTITMSLAIGLLLGVLLKPSRTAIG